MGLVLRSSGRYYSMVSSHPCGSSKMERYMGKKGKTMLRLQLVGSVGGLGGASRVQPAE